MPSVFLGVIRAYNIKHNSEQDFDVCLPPMSRISKGNPVLTEIFWHDELLEMPVISESILSNNPAQNKPSVHF